MITTYLRRFENDRGIVQVVTFVRDNQRLLIGIKDFMLIVPFVLLYTFFSGAAVTISRTESISESKRAWVVVLIILVALFLTPARQIFTIRKK